MEHDPGTPGLRARVRWGNVAKALALLAVVALVVSWPRLRASEPQVPAGTAVSVSQAPAAPPTTTTQPADETTPATRARTVRKQQQRTTKPKPKPRHRSRRTKRRAPPAPAPAPVRPTHPPPPWHAPPRQTEFSVE